MSVRQYTTYNTELPRLENLALQLVDSNPVDIVWDAVSYWVYSLS